MGTHGEKLMYEDIRRSKRPEVLAKKMAEHLRKCIPWGPEDAAYNERLALSLVEYGALERKRRG